MNFCLSRGRGLTCLNVSKELRLRAGFGARGVWLAAQRSGWWLRRVMLRVEAGKDVNSNNKN